MHRAQHQWLLLNADVNNLVESGKLLQALQDGHLR